MPGATAAPGFFMISELTIILGFRCNFKCEHCMVAGQTGTELSPGEKAAIIAAIKKHRIRRVLFVGGEPTLYIKDINDIVSRLDGLKINFRITTNGHFASSRQRALAVISSIKNLSGLNLSYDRLHQKFLPEANVGRLYKACREMKKDFAVIISLLSPLDLLMVKKLRQIGRFAILPQKLLPLGAAKANNIGYQYPSFDKGILKKRCPNQRGFTYLCGRGFTTCCSAMALAAKPGRAIHDTIGRHRSSEFHKLVSGSTFGEIADKFGLSGLRMLPEHSAPCVMCEYLFRSKYGKNL